MASVEEINKLYREILGRDADKSALPGGAGDRTWQTPDQIRADLLTSGEYVSKKGNRRDREEHNKKAIEQGNWNDVYNPDTGERLRGWKNPETGEISGDPNWGYGKGSIPLWGEIPGIKHINTGQPGLDNVPVYSKEFIGDKTFDMVGENKAAIVPKGTKLDNRMHIVQESGDWLVVTRRKKEQWYQEDWVAIAAGVAAAFVLGPAGLGVTGSISGAVSGAVGAVTGQTVGAIAGTTISGAVTTGISAGISTELAGGDFVKGFEQGAVVGGLTGGIAGGLTAGVQKIVGKGDIGLKNVAAIRGAATAAATGITQKDWEEALKAGGFAAATRYMRGKPKAQAIIQGARAAEAGGTWEEIATMAATGYAGGKYALSAREQSEVDTLEARRKQLESKDTLSETEKDELKNIKSRTFELSARANGFNDLQLIVGQTIRSRIKRREALRKIQDKRNAGARPTTTGKTVIQNVRQNARVTQPPMPKPGPAARTIVSNIFSE